MRLNSNLKVNYASLKISFFTAFLPKGMVTIFDPFPEINTEPQTFAVKNIGELPLCFQKGQPQLSTNKMLTSYMILAKWDSSHLSSHVLSNKRSCNTTSKKIKYIHH